MPAILVLLLALLPAAASAPGREEPLLFHVAPDGHDGWSGRLAAPNAERTDGPFATVHRAQEAVRAELATGAEDRGIAKDRGIHVRIAPGFYALDRPLVLTGEDSGPAEEPVLWKGGEGAPAVLSGGRVIEGWHVGEDGRWRAVLPAVRDGEWAFSELWANDQRRFRPRRPEEGYFTIAAEVPPTAAGAGRGQDRFAFRPGDIDPGWHALADVEIQAFHFWSASRLRIAAIDAAGSTVTFTGPTWTVERYGGLPAGHRYLAINVREALDDPGEWYLDRATGELTYLPLLGETPANTTVIAPHLETVVRIAGDLPARRFVQNVEFVGLTFAHTAWNLPPAGQSFPQAEVQLPAAIEAVGARGVAIEGCTVRHTGGYAIAFGAGCRDCRVRRCDLADLGAGGVKLGTGGGPQSWMIRDFDPADPEAAAERLEVEHSRIAHGGRLHPAGIGVWIGHAAHCRVSSNDLRDFYYTGVSVGWTWGYAEPSQAHHNEIAWNRIADIGQGVLSDLAGVYTLGVSPGTSVHHNVIHDVDAYDYGGWGLYTDEGSTGIAMTQNLVYRTKTGGFHQHYGRENVIADNVFAEAKTQQLQRSRAEEHLSFTFERNIVYWTNESPLLGSDWSDDHFVLDRNLYWNPRFPDVRFPGGLTFAAWREQRGHDQESVIADPLFLDPAHDDFRLAAESPALALGFEAWDYLKAGLIPEPRPSGDLPSVPPGFR
ncbi:MAG: hypothetical protein AB1726_04185 [Planctomycetota bacterium]